MKCKAFAKINLSLNVKGKLENGYHEMEMIMVPIDLYDFVEIELADEMEYSCNAKYLAFDSKNTMVKAVNLLREEFQFKENFHISLHKYIPTQAGLAGGSTDAAAVIKMINRILHLNMNKEKIKEIAKKIGADVPFFIDTKPSVVEGIGEILTPFEINTDFHILLVKPKQGVSTKACFEALNMKTCQHPDSFAMKEALINNDYEKVVDSLGNTLEGPAMKFVKEIKLVKEQLIDLGFDGALMSGSGSTVFALTKDKDLVSRAEVFMRSKGYFAKKTKILK